MPITQLQRALLGSPGLFLADEDLKEAEEGTCSTVVPAASVGERACAGHHHLLPQTHQVSHAGPTFFNHHATHPVTIKVWSMGSSRVLGLIIAVSICEHVGGTAHSVMGQLGHKHKKGSSSVRLGCSALIRESRVPYPHGLLPRTCVPLYTLQSGSGPVLGPGLGCSSRDGAEPVGWGGLRVPHGLGRQGLDSRKPGRGSKPQMALTVGGTVSWGVIFQGWIGLLLCGVFIYFLKLILWPNKCVTTCFWFTKNSCKHNAKQAVSRYVNVCLYFRDGVAI